MGKSIENIWKEGFNKSDSLKAPQISNLYSHKSIHIIDKFKRMFRANLMAIVVISLVFLFVSYLLHIFIAGIIIFITCLVLVIINKRLLTQLEKIDQGQSSYKYLKAFSHWIKMQIEINRKVSHFIYPIFFLAIILGLWYSNSEDLYLGERIVNRILVNFPNTYLVFGIPLVGIVIIVLIMVLLAILGGRIYQWDFKLIYGKVFNKIEEQLEDLEKLN